MRGLQPVVSAASLIVSASTCRQCSGTLTQLCQGCDDAWIELCARAAAELVEGFRRRERLAVGAAADHRIVGVARADDARAERDFLAAQPVGIAAAVPALVSGTHEPRDRPHRLRRAEDALPRDRVLAHDRPLRRVEWTGLVEDLVRDGDRADIVEL